MHFLRPRRRADSDTSTISLVATALTFSADGSGFDSADVLPDTSRAGTGHIHSHVAAADHNDLVADGEFVAEIHVKEKVDALVNAIQINAEW